MRTAVLHTMGTVVSLAAPDSDRFQEAADAAFAHLRHVDEVFSPYRADSPVSRIRDGRLDPRRLGGHPHAAELDEVLDLCARLHAESDGAFDAWAVGDPPRFDPSGAVKGWAAERASEVLARHGLPRHVLNAGGDVRLRAGHDPDAASWSVGLAHPLRRGRLLGTLTVTDGAVATSGSAERGAHIWQPASGRRADALAQVTVVGPDLALADGYATAAMAHADGASAHAWLSRLAARDGYRSVTVDTAGAVRTVGGIALATPPAAGDGSDRVGERG